MWTRSGEVKDHHKLPITLIPAIRAKETDTHIHTKTETQKETARLQDTGQRATEQRQAKFAREWYCF